MVSFQIGPRDLAELNEDQQVITPFPDLPCSDVISVQRRANLIRSFSHLRHAINCRRLRTLHVSEPRVASCGFSRLCARITIEAFLPPR